MKKTYISPSMKVYQLQATPILTESYIDYGGPNTDGPGTAQGKSALDFIDEYED